jgi:NADPH:quinone reductase-like Zn-dependent oxidoreductase
MIATGALVQEWPFTPGCELSGVVVKAGSKAINAIGTHFKDGDEVFTVTRIGTSKHQRSKNM